MALFPSDDMAKQIVNLSKVAMVDLAPLEAHFFDGFPELWREFATSIYTFLLCAKEPLAAPPVLAEIAIGLVSQISHDFGGTQPYIPNGLAFEKKRMAAQIRNEFRGNNFRQLGRKYGVSESRVRQIVSQD